MLTIEKLEKIIQALSDQLRKWKSGNTTVLKKVFQIFILKKHLTDPASPPVFHKKLYQEYSTTPQLGKVEQIFQSVYLPKHSFNIKELCCDGQLPGHQIDQHL